MPPNISPCITLKSDRSLPFPTFLFFFFLTDCYGYAAGLTLIFFWFLLSRTIQHIQKPRISRICTLHNSSTRQCANSLIGVTYLFSFFCFYFFDCMYSSVHQAITFTLIDQDLVVIFYIYIFFFLSFSFTAACTVAITPYHVNITCYQPISVSIFVFFSFLLS